MSFIKKLFSFSLIAYMLVVPVFMLYADTKFSDTPPADISGTTKLVNPIKVDNINDFIKILLQGVLKIGMPIIALAIIYSGFLFVEARGKPDEITKAKDALTYTLIGAAILLGSWAIAQLIANTVLSL
ncbi:MAG: pilin [Patescibacteria group bacterium]